MSEVVDISKKKVLMTLKVSQNEKYDIVMPSRKQVKELHEKFTEAGDDALLTEMVTQEFIAVMGLPVEKQDELPADISALIMSKFKERTELGKK